MVEKLVNFVFEKWRRKMDRKLYLFLFILLLLFQLSACQNKEPINFTGEGENWSTEVQVSPANGNEENKKINLQYKGNNVKSVGDFDFKVEAPNGQWGMGIIQLNDEGVFVDDSKGSVSRKTSKSDELKIIINWNDKTENFPLKSN